MKKTYIVPSMELSQGVVAQMIAASITRVEGDSKIQLGTGEVPGNADVKGVSDSDNFWEGEW